MSDTTVVSREQTQLKLDRRAPIAAKYLADTPYTMADRLEDCSTSAPIKWHVRCTSRA